jgi:clan AA aspartic protease (TIGR02281 family)
MLRTAFLTGAAVLALGAAYPARAQTLYRCVPDEQRVTAPDRLVSVEITLKPNGEFASIVYRAASGAVYDRAKQYEATSSQDRTGQHYWAGTLRANPNVAMVGSLNRIGDRLVYFETIHDKLQGGKVVSQVTSSCEPIVAEATPPPASAAPTRPVSLPDRKIVLDCGPSTVLVGETERNGVVATTVSHDPVRSSWSVIHHLADSTVVARETQYSMVDASQGVGAGAWAGYLNRNHNLQMIGRLTIDKQSDGLVYEEFLYDRGHSDQLIMHSQTNCAPTTTVFQSTPPTLQPSAPASISRGNSVPIYFERDGRAVFVDVTLGSQPAHLLIDTGSTNVTVSESLAEELLSRGEADEAPSAQVQLADGSTTTARNIYVHTLKIGDNVLRNVRAGVTPDGADMLLGFPVLNQIGRFTVDTIRRPS